jgi:hypothetical protein
VFCEFCEKDGPYYEGQDVSYTQCVMSRRLSASSSEHQTAYVPTAYAAVGAVLRLRADDGTWSGGWVVSSIHDTRPGRRLAAIGGGHGFRGNQFPFV